MWILWVALGVAVLIAAVLVASYICYRMAFYMSPKQKSSDTELSFLSEDVYEAITKASEKWAKEMHSVPCEDFYTESFDGLKLHAKYYEYKPGAPIELMFHGYRSNAERDMVGGIRRSFLAGRSVLLVDQRCCGKSEGRTITFGINEHRDCLTWVDFACRQFGPDVKIILTGISMGAATVLMAGGKPLPENVLGILADCSYSSARDIIRKVIKDMHIPVWLGYPFVKLGARLYGHFNLEETSPLEAVQQCKVPVIFYHGQSDSFVPCSMSHRLHDACASRKQLVIIPNADHGLSYPVAPELYLQTLKEFFGPEASSQE